MACIIKLYREGRRYNLVNRQEVTIATCWPPTDGKDAIFEILPRPITSDAGFWSKVVRV